jgi:nitroimidazol reductase NimA-like FMN-containing flavoprotein (pyridoxamine 5'-phosphate oxidase superfamily)
VRRKDRQVVEIKEMEKIISRCQVCHLALSDPSGHPYALALNFGYQPSSAPVLYFHCAKEGRKLDLIRANPRAAFIIDRALELITGPMACDWGMDYESIMGAGCITIVTDPQERKRGLDIIMAHYGNPSPAYAPESLQQTVVLKLTISEMTGKRNA